MSATGKVKRKVKNLWTVLMKATCLCQFWEKQYYCQINHENLAYVCIQTAEGTDEPLQYSCLEIPMDWGTWQVRSMGSQRVGHDWVTNTHTHTHTHTKAHTQRYSKAFLSLQQSIQAIWSHKSFLREITLLDENIKIIILYNFERKRKFYF